MTYYHSNVLPWTPVPEEDRRFRNIVTSVTAISVALAVVMSLVTLPKVDRLAVREVPPQLAKLILEREKPKPPPPKVEEKKEERKEEKKKEEKKPEKKPEEKKPEPEKPVEPEKPKVDLEAARKKAAKSGLLALSDDLADLRESRPPELGKNIAVTKAATKAQAAAAPELITSNARGSGGINTSDLTRATRRTSGELQGRATETVESPVEAQAKVERDLSSSRGGRVSPRTNEEITLVFERYKSVLTQMHQRALRSDPNAKGKVVLELTIEPSGSVSSCRVVSSEFDSPDFLSKVVARVKSFDFGEKNVEKVTITYPLEFIPLS